MKRNFLIAIWMTLATTVLLGIVYPLVVTGLAQVLYPHRANGELIEIVEIGKQLLITRGALTTFSVSNDVAKYFAIIPAMFAGAFPQLGVLNVMGLKTPQSAVLSAVIFNALIIIALVPLALRGVRYRPLGAEALLRRNLLIYGFGGIVAPFIGIKLIDMLITRIGLA